MKGLILHCFLSLSDNPSHPRLWEGCFLHCLLQPPFPTFFFLNKGSVSFFINCLWRPARNQCLRPKREKLKSYSFSLYVQKEKRLKDVGKFSLENSKPGIISSSHNHHEIKICVWPLGWEGSSVCIVIHKRHFLFGRPRTKMWHFPPDKSVNWGELTDFSPYFGGSFNLLVYQQVSEMKTPKNEVK